MVDVADGDAHKKRNIDFHPDYFALANHVRDIVEAPSLRSNPRDEFHCICDTCFRGTFKGKVLPISEFQTKQKSKPGGLNSSHGDYDPREGTSSSSSGIHFNLCTMQCRCLYFF